MRILLFLVMLLAFRSASPALAAPGTAGMDDGAPYHATSYHGAPDLGLTLALVVAGGGPSAFDAGKLIGVLAGSNTDAEVTKLNRQFGSKNVTSFIKTFTFAVDDVLQLVQKNDIVLPATPSPDPTDGKLLSAALYTAGTMPNGRFDIGYMIEHAISHRLHVELMRDINADPNYGPWVNANFHTILTQAVLDLKVAYSL